MSTIPIDTDAPRPAARRMRLAGVLAAGAVAAAGAFGAGWALAPSGSARADARPFLFPAGQPHTVQSATRESLALKWRAAAATDETRVVTAGGWTGLVHSATGIPVAAGIPGAEGP